MILTYDLLVFKTLFTDLFGSTTNIKNKNDIITS